MTETVSSVNPKVSFVSMNFSVQTRGNVVAENGTSIGLEDPYLNVAGQLIFKGAQPTVTQVSGGPLEIFFNLSSQSETKINFYVTAFEYPKIGSSLGNSSCVLMISS